MLHRLSRYRKQALRIGQIVLVLFSFIFLGIAIEQNWSEIRSSAVNFDALTFSFAVLILFLAWI